MKKTLRIVKISTLIIFVTLALYVALLVWLHNCTWHYDGATTITYTGSLSRIDYELTRRTGRWSRPEPHYTVCFSDGERFSMNVNAARELIGKETSDTLLALPEGETLTVIVTKESGELLSLRSSEQVFVSLDSYNQWMRWLQRFWYLFIAGFLSVLVLLLEIFFSFLYFRQLHISLGKQRRKARRKQERSKLKEGRKADGS